MDGENGNNDSVTNPPSLEVEPCTSNDNLSFTESSENKIELSKINTESSENEIEPSEVTNVSDQNIHQTAINRGSCIDNVELIVQKSPELESASSVLENTSSSSIEVNENDTCGIQDSNDETHKPDTQPSEAEESNDQSHESNVERITPPDDINDQTKVFTSENADIPPLISDNDRTCTSDSIPPAVSVDSIPVTSDFMETFSDFKHQDETFKGSCALGIENVSNEPDVSSCKDSPTLDLEDTQKSSGTDIELADASKNIDDKQVEDDFKKESQEEDVTKKVNNDVKEAQLISFEAEQNESTGNVESSVNLQKEKEEHNEEKTDKLEEEKHKKDEEGIERENEEEIDGKIEDRDNTLDPCLSAANNTANENHGKIKSSPVEISSYSTELSEEFNDSKEPSTSSGHVSQNEGMEVDDVFHSQDEESLFKQSTDSPTEEIPDKAESLALDSQIPCSTDVEAEQKTSDEISSDKTSKPCEPRDISENSNEIALDSESKSCETMDVSEDTDKVAVNDFVCQGVTNDFIIDTPKDKGPDDFKQLPHDKDVKIAEDTSSGDKFVDDSDNQKINGAQIKSERRGSTETLKDTILSNENVANDDEAKNIDDVGEGKDSNAMDVIESFEPSTNSNTSEKSVEAATTDVVHLKKTKGLDNLNNYVESKISADDSFNSVTIVSQDQDMSRKSKSKVSSLGSSNIDVRDICEKFNCKPLTIRADINVKELKKLKFPEILGNLLSKTLEEQIQQKKSNEGDAKNDNETAISTRSAAKTAALASDTYVRPRQMVGPKRFKTSVPPTILAPSTNEVPPSAEYVRPRQMVGPKRFKTSVPSTILAPSTNEVPPSAEYVRPRQMVGPKRFKTSVPPTIEAPPSDTFVRPRQIVGPKRVKESKHAAEIERKIAADKNEGKVVEEILKIKCKKMDIAETNTDVKRLIIKSKSSINESVQPAKKRTSIVADVVDLEAVEDRVTKNPLRLYEVSKELRKMARKTELINKVQKAAEIRKQYQLEEITSEMDSSCKVCDNCKKMRPSVWRISDPGMNHSFCSLYCGIRFKLRRDNSSVQAKRRSCGGCSKQVQLDEKSLTWKTVNYCDEKCLTKVFTALGDVCGNCNSHIPFKMRGRYILQRGIMREIFCSSMCRAYHKTGAKICTVCCKPTSDGMRMTTIGEFKLCSQECVRKLNQYKKTTGSLSYCSVCNLNKPVQYVVLSPKGPINNLCSEKCFKAFNFVNKLDVFSCNLCERFFDKVKHDESILSFFDDLQFNYCSKFCHQFYASEAKLKAKCAYCKGEKNKLSMIRRVYEDQEYFYCTPNCMNMLSVCKMVTSRSKQCEHCKSYSTDSFFLASHAANKNFCSYKCVYNFHNNIPSTQFFKSPASVQSNSMSKIVISDVRSLGAPNAFPTPAIPSKHTTKPVRPIQAGKIIKPKVEVTKILPRIIRQILVKPQEKKEMKNTATQVHPTMSNKRVSCKTTQVAKEIQTGEDLGRPLLIPVPVPLYIPAPAAMYSVPFPVLIPVPIPIPVPVFIPTTRNSAAGIFKEIKRIQEKIPADPFEAELLMMAEMVASDKKDEGGTTDDDSNAADDDFDNETGQGMETSSNAFGEDVLQMAIKMACNDLEPSGALQAVDLDDTLQAATIPITQPQPRTDGTAEDMDPYRGANRGRKRTTPAKPPIPRAPPIKRQRRTSDIIAPPVPTPAPPPPMEIEKPDVNMCLKYTFGVNAWRQWVVQKNQELEKAASAAPRKPGLQKLFKAEILQLTADELNFSLCLFVQEVRKPNGTQYAPDTIYYLCLGIQQYLFESGRIDNIFTDPYYEKFTEALDEVCCKFSALYNDTQFIVTRVEEEHLWESKQLGAHSPHVLLNTLMFFNTKHFNLITVEEHMQLSFSHIMKHWKRNPGMAGSIATNCTKAPPGSRNVLLRFYPPQSAIDAPGSRKKKVYEQQENEENPLRCPVRLYEFYLSKCPESVKTRNDVFYLLPERSCVPDSPVWYSTSPLPKEALMKMLHRIKMVKEINIAFLST